MSQEIIKFQSPEKSTPDDRCKFGTDMKSGICCTWKMFSEFDPSSEIKEKFMFMAWKFEWKELRRQNVIGFKGHLIAYHRDWKFQYVPTKIEVELVRSGQWIEKRIIQFEQISKSKAGDRYFKYEFNLTPIYDVPDTNLIAEHFKTLSLDDSVLVVEKQKIPVNKAFLSCQSQYFHKIFKENQLEEIPIEDVSYEDFMMLLSVIHPKTVPPTDKTAPKLLELAERFSMPAVTCHVESYLLSSPLELMEKLYLADKYNLKRLVEHCTWQVGTLRQIERITRSEHYNSYSKDTQQAILNRILAIL